MGYDLAHPNAAYFGVGKTGRDLVESYAERKDVSVEQVEKWLSPNRGYDPEKLEGADKDKKKAA